MDVIGESVDCELKVLVDMLEAGGGGGWEGGCAGGC